MERKTFGLTAAMLAGCLLAASCSSTRFASVDTRAEPLTPAPVAPVTGRGLPPAAKPAPAPAAPASADPAQFPSAPATGTDVASAAPSAPPASAPDVTAGGVAGVWNASVSGQSCRVATPQTKFGQGFRAGPLRCPAPVDGVRSWNVGGKQLSLYDEGGSVVARLYSSGPDRFDGQTSSGQPISLSR